MKEKHLINFWAYARELHSFLKEYHIAPDHPVSDKEMLKAIEELIINLAYSVISDTRHPLMPKFNITDLEAYELFEKASQLAAIPTMEVLNETILMDNLLFLIYEIVVHNPWNVWVVDRNGLENSGDYRLLQWAQEHIVNGEYSLLPIIKEDNGLEALNEDVLNSL